MARVFSKNKDVPGWSKKVRRLRADLHMSQGQLGEELQYSSMAISRWEHGIQEPSAEAYIKLGKLAGEPDRWFFWERAGLKKTDVQNGSPRAKGAFSDVEIVLAGSGVKRKIPKKTLLVAIPLLQVHAGSHGEEGDQVIDISECPTEEVIAAPVAWCPNPETTSC